MAGVKSGTFGLVMNSGAVIAQIRSWAFARNQEIQEYTVLGDSGYRSKRPIFKNENVDCELYWDDTDTAGQVALETSYDAATVLTLVLYPSATGGVATAGDILYTGQAYVSDLSLAGDAEDLVSGTANFAVDGPMVRSVEPV